MPSHDFRAPRLFVDGPLAQDARVPLDRDQSNYLGNVLRLAARVNTERMRANVVEAAEQCGILSIATVAEPVPLERFLGQRAAGRLLIFCDEAAELENPIQSLQ